MALNIYSFYRRWQPGFRARRRQVFLDALRPSPTTTILDVGGNHYDWEDLTFAPPITIVNVDDIPAAWQMPPNFTYRVGDGRRLDFPDQSFDIVYANSVIEHLRTWEDQQRFAAEMCRVGRQVFVQTPNRGFPIEPHFLALGVHWLPRRWHRQLFRWGSVRGWLRSGDNIALDALTAELRLLTAGEMWTLFPDCEIVREKVCGLTKSLIAVRRAPA